MPRSPRNAITVPELILRNRVDLWSETTIKQTQSPRQSGMCWGAQVHGTLPLWHAGQPLHNVWASNRGPEGCGAGSEDLELGPRSRLARCS